MTNNYPLCKVKKYRVVLLTALALAFSCTALHAQINNDDNSTSGDTKSQKEFYKRKKEQDKALAKATKAALKHQRDIQSPEVRKRMKRDARKAKMYNEHKREFFLKRWFRKKEPRGKPNSQTGGTNNK